MEPSPGDLKERYSGMLDHELVGLHLQGTLTDEASKVLAVELQLRNISLDRGMLIKEYGEINDTAPGVRETAGVAVKKTISWVVSVVIILVIVIVLNLVLMFFGSYMVPFIWSSEIDKTCQETGYWYGELTNNPEEIECKKWFVTP